MPMLPANLESIQKIVAEHQCYKLHWSASKRLPKGRNVLVDATTAHAVMTVYNALNPENKQKLERLVRMGPDKVVEVAALAWRK